MPSANTKLLSIAIPASVYKRLERLAKQSDLTLEDWVLKTLNHSDRLIRRNEEFAAAVAATRADARRNGTDKLTMRKINEEIAVVRHQLQAEKTRRSS